MPAPGLWTPDTSAYLKVGIGAAALGLVAWNLARSPLPRSGSEAATGVSTARAKALRVLGFLGLLAYFNFGSFHFQGIYVHLWDSLHHVLGAKYIDELGYDGLYECIAVADAEDPRLAARADQRLITDLRTNETVTAADVVAHPERCRARFSDPRWTSFKTDVAVFRARFPDADWQRVTGDHGFNASPVWVLAARPFVASAPITDTRLAVLASIDPVLMLAAFAALAWAFGFERAALAAIVWGTYFPARLWWTGGSFCGGIGWRPCWAASRFVAAGARCSPVCSSGTRRFHACSLASLSSVSRSRLRQHGFDGARCSVTPHAFWPELRLSRVC